MFILTEAFIVVLKSCYKLVLNLYPILLTINVMSYFALSLNTNFYNIIKFYKTFDIFIIFMKENYANLQSKILFIAFDENKFWEQKMPV